LYRYYFRNPCQSSLSSTGERFGEAEWRAAYLISIPPTYSSFEVSDHGLMTVGLAVTGTPYLYLEVQIFLAAL
jgi:hypothetical protein